MYEPADMLLERIKAEQGKSGKKSKAAKEKSTHTGCPKTKSVCTNQMKSISSGIITLNYNQ